MKEYPPQKVQLQRGMDIPNLRYYFIQSECTAVYKGNKSEWWTFISEPEIIYHSFYNSRHLIQDVLAYCSHFSSVIKYAGNLSFSDTTQSAALTFPLPCQPVSCCNTMNYQPSNWWDTSDTCYSNISQSPAVILLNCCDTQISANHLVKP